MLTLTLRWAQATTGSRKALTPLLTASTPVIAVHPAANDRSSNQMLTASVGRAGWRDDCGFAAGRYGLVHADGEDQDKTRNKQVRR